MFGLHAEILRVIDDFEFGVIDNEIQDGENYITLERFTPAGEDWCPIIWFDGTNEGFVESVRKLYENFDVDEEAEIYIENRGKNGIPSSIRTLINDAEWKEDVLGELAEELEKLDLEEEEEESDK